MKENELRAMLLEQYDARCRDQPPLRHGLLTVRGVPVG